MPRRIPARESLALLAAVLLTACGTPVRDNQLQTVAAQAPAPIMAQSKADNEPVPSAAQLKELEFTSPDELIDNAPAEPGMNAECVWPCPPKEDLGNFGKLNDGLWRGARPSDKGLAQLQGMGVKTIVNLENSKGAVMHEAGWCQAHGVKFVSIPLSVILPPKEEKIKQFLALANDPSNLPLYFHCMQGRDRTGTAAFCYRISQDGYPFDKAYSEMKSYHFHTYLLGLQGFLHYYAHEHRPGTPNPAPVK